MLFMAITSTGSAEMIAVSSLLTYDVYRRYFKPEATGKQILFISRITVIVWAVVMFLLNIILDQIGQATEGTVSLGWVYNFMGIMIGSAVLPIAFLLLWEKCSAVGACSGAILGNVCALIVWLSHAASICEMDGLATEDSCTGSPVKCGISAKTLGTLGPQLSGNLVAILSSGLICAIVSFIKPQNYDFSKMNGGIKLVEDSLVLGENSAESSPEFLRHARQWIVKFGVGGTILILILWPIAVLPWRVFSKSCYMMWSSIVVMWGLLAAVYIIGMPLFENLEIILAVLRWKPIQRKELEGASKADPTEVDPTGADPIKAKTGADPIKAQIEIE